MTFQLSVSELTFKNSLTLSRDHMMSNCTKTISAHESQNVSQGFCLSLKFELAHLGNRANMARKASITAKDCISTSPAKNCRIILTAPHGGKRSFHTKNKNPFLERRDMKGICKLSDLNTIEMLQDIKRYVMKASAKSIRPYTIYLKVHRKYIDANRNKSQYPFRTTKNNQFGKQVYDLYHKTIQKAINKIESKYGKGKAILIDIHGQAYMNSCLMIGNKDGKTCGYNFQSKDDNDIDNRNITHKLISHALNSSIKIKGWHEKQERYDGGYTVQKYSGFINKTFQRIAIQFEFGRELRTNRTEIAKYLALGISDISTRNPANIVTNTPL